MTRRARARRALAACALLPLSAWAQTQNQPQIIPPQFPAPVQQIPGQAQTQTGQDQGYAQGASPGTPPPNRTDIYATAGLGETDNVALSPSPTQSQTIADVGIVADVARQGPVLNGTVKGELDYLEYLQHYYPGQLVGRLDADGSLVLVTDRIKWVLDESYGDAQVDALAAPNRNNIQSVNVVSTGPDFLWRAGENNFLRLGARYQAADYETSPFDSQRVLGTASIGRDLTLATSISLNADVASIRFQNNDVSPDYERRKFYLRYDAQGVRTTLSLVLGAAQSDDTGPYITKLLAQLQLTRQISPFQTIFISGSQQLTDNADSFSALTSGAAGYTIIAPAAGTGGNYLADSAAAGWTYKRNRTTLALSANWERDDYTLQPTPEQINDYLTEGTPAALNVTRSTLGARLTRELTPLITAEVHAAYTHEDYTTLLYRDHSLFCGASVDLKPNHVLSYRLLFDHQMRTVDQVPALIPPGTGQGYTQNSLFLTVAYRLTE
jgi:hypothetical protein